MRFAVLGSGSRGNSTLVHSHNTYILIDCGFPLRETLRRLARLGVEPTQLKAILVTHEHSDHVHGVELLSRRYNIPVYLTEGTARGLRKPIAATRVLAAGDTLELDALEVRSVSVSHDAYDPTQFVFFNGKRRLGVLTDLGEATTTVLECYRDLDALVIEANHDRRLLDEGPYPYFLKARVSGSHGHLSNQQAAALVCRLECDALQHLVLAHLSEKNNRPHLARQTFVDTLGCDTDWLQVADQHEGIGWQLIA